MLVLITLLVKRITIDLKEIKVYCYFKEIFIYE